MKTNLRQTKLTLLLGLLALSGLTAYAYRASEQWRGYSAKPGTQSTAILSHTRGRNAVGPVVTLTSAAAVTQYEVLLTAEDAEPETALAPAQSGGSYNITQAVIGGGGGTSANGTTNVTGTVGQSAAAASTGGSYTVSGGFWEAGASGGCLAITVSPVNATLPAGQAGQSYTQTLTALGGTPAYSFAISAGALPTGLTLSVGGTLSGTPTVFGPFNFMVRATDANLCTGERAYSLMINPQCPDITVGPPTLPNGAAGIAYNQMATATGGAAPYTFAISAGTLPGGLTLASGGALTGTPAQLGAFNFTITLTDANGCTGNRGYTLTISPACNTLSATPATLPAGTEGVAYSQSLSGSGGVAPYTFTIEQATLPVPGLSLAANGTITGTPTATGTFPFEVNITDVNGCVGISQHTITINPSCPTITVTPQTLASATVGQTYDGSMSANNGDPGYTFEVTAGTLPNGLTLSTTGSISGTPTQTGIFNFTVKATDGNGCMGQVNAAITVNCPVIAVVPPPPNGSVGTAYNHTFNATGNAGPYTYSIIAGALPTSLTLTPAGTLTGTPTANGNFNFTVRATSSSGCTDEASFSVSIVTCQAITIAQFGLPTATVGTAYNVQLNTIGGAGPFTWSLTAGVLPSGLTFTAAGLFVETPTQTGIFPIRVRATDTTGCAGDGNYVLVVGAAGCNAVTVNPDTLPNAFNGMFFSQQLTADGGNGPYTFTLTAGSFPSGLSLSPTGLLSGTVAAIGVGNFRITATDANQCVGSREYQILVINCSTITINPATLPSGTVNASYNQTLTADFGLPPYSFAVTGGALPGGLTLSTAGVLSGTPTASGNSNFTVTATAANGCKGQQTYPLVINNAACPTITVNPANATLPAGQTGQQYNQTFTQTGGNGAITFTISAGALPNGLLLSTSGVLSGAPTASGDFNFTVKATDTTGCAGTRGYNLTISAPCPTITVNPANATLPIGQVGQSYNQTFTQTAGNGTATFTIGAGALPNGLSLSTAGVLSGAPTAFGNFNFTVKATEANGCMGSRAYSLTVNPPCATITVNPTTLPNGTVDTAYNQTVTATGGTPAYIFTISAGSLPGGLNLASGGALTGTPNTSGVFNFTIKATDASNCMGTLACTVTISGGVVNNGLQFYALPKPLRLLDTRPGQLGCDTPGAQIPGNTSRTQLARRTCDGITIPATALAVTGNITTVQSGGGYLTLYPSDVAQPLVANSNYAANEILNNVFTVGLGNADGSFKIFVTSDTHVVVDVTGYYAPPAAGGLYFHPLPKPIRLLETRPGFSGAFTPGVQLQSNADTPQQARVTYDGVTIPATALAIVGNATTVNSGAGYLTLYPGGVPRPLAASSNFSAGQVMNAPFTVGLSATGVFNIFTTTSTDAIVDVLGYYSADANDGNGAGLLFNPLPAPVRLLETRAGFTGCYIPNAPLATGSTRQQQARGPCGGQTIAANALAIVGNATVINNQAGYLTFWPNGAAQPLVASSNFAAGQILNRHFTVGLGATGIFNIFASAQTDLIVDVSGFFAP